MKKVVLSVVCLIVLVSMSFTKSNSNKIIDSKETVGLNFKKDFNINKTPDIKGDLVMMLTLFPGWSTNLVVPTDSQTKEFSDKMDAIINKY